MYADLKMELDSPILTFQQSSNLQGVIMENIQAEYAERLHENRLNPYSQCLVKENTGEQSKRPLQTDRRSL